MLYKSNFLYVKIYRGVKLPNNASKTYLINTTVNVSFLFPFVHTAVGV